jgi:polygalacturonase
MKGLHRRDFVKTGMIGAAGIFIPGLGMAIDSVSREKEYNIVDFGAVGDGKSMNTPAIQQAIEVCYQDGGGKLVVPAGVFLTGSVTLKKNIHLYLKKNAILLASKHIKDFPERHLLSECRYKQYLRRALIFAQGEEGITISGEGTVDGNFDPETEGEFKEKDEQNPPLLWFDECKNILVRDISLRRSVWWTTAFSRSRNIHVDHVKITGNYSYNTDGCDILDCESFIIENCDINTNDDGICLKGYTNEGCRRGIIRNNKIRSLCNAIKMGTDSSGGFRDITISDNEIWQTGISGMALEIVDGGIMENIIVRRIIMNGIGTPLFIRLGNRDRQVSESRIVPHGILRNVHISKITAYVNKPEKYNEQERLRHDYDAYTSSVTGIPGYYVENVTIEDIEIIIEGGFPQGTETDALRKIPEASKEYPENRMFGKLPSYAFYLRHARGLQMNNVRVSILKKDARPAILLDDVHDSVLNDITIGGENSSAAFSIQANCSTILLNNRKNSQEKDK